MAGDAHDAARHMVLSIGISLERTADGDSPVTGLDLLEDAPRHASRVAEVFERFGYTRIHVPEPCGDYDGLVRDVLKSSDADVLVLHVVGHGELCERSGDLYLLDHEGNRLALPVSSWIGMIEAHPTEQRPMTLLILDVCHAGEAAVLAWHSRMDETARRAWVLAATRPADRAYGYRLSRALVEVLGTYLSGEVRFDPSVRHIPAPAVWRDVGRVVDELWQRADGVEQRISSSLVPSHADLAWLPFFPNPFYRPDASALAGLPPEIARLADWGELDPQHFIRRAAGTEVLGRGWDSGCFSGREEQLDELAPWLDDAAAGPRLHVVTGKPGVGKSALLGILVCAAHPRLREPTEPLWRGLGERAPGRNDRIAVVHARRLKRDQIVDSLARQLREIRGDAEPARAGDDPRAAAGSENPVDHLLDLLPVDGPQVTIVIDALDEATAPEDTTNGLLLPLAEAAVTGGHRLRLLVGTRDDPGLRPLTALACDQGCRTDLSDADPATVRQDLAAYVNRLLATADSPYADGARRPVRNALAAAIADELTSPRPVPDPRSDPAALAADGADLFAHVQAEYMRLFGRWHPAPSMAGDRGLQWGEFLTAGLYVHHLLTTRAPFDTAQEAASAGRAVPRELPAVLDLDLRRNAGRPLLRPVLTALAFALGQGMPESVLAHAAAAFVADGDGDPVPWQELQELLGREARFYLRREVDEDGTTLFRLFHEGLTEWLRHDVLSDSHPASPVPQTDPDDEHTRPTPHPVMVRLHRRLTDCVEGDELNGRRWERAAPYLLRHAAQHALDAGCLDALLLDAGFLVHADPHALADAVAHARDRPARRNAAVYRASWGVHHALPPASRQQVLAMDAARFRHTGLQAELGGDPHWSVRWATAHQVSPALVRTLATNAKFVIRVAVADLDGRPHVITAGNKDGSVQVWDLTTGLLSRILTGHTGRMQAMAVAQLDDRPHLVTSDRGGSLQLWDLATGVETRRLADHTEVMAMAVTQLAGQPHLVAVEGVYGSKVAYLWDLTTGRRVRRIASGLRGIVSSVIVTEVKGVPSAFLVSFGDDHRAFDLATGTQTLALSIGTLRAVTAATLAGRQHLVVAHSNDEELQVWDLTRNLINRRRVDMPRTLWFMTGTLTDPEAEFTPQSLATVIVDGRTYTIAGCGDGTVRVWNLATGTLVGTLVGHTDLVNALAVVRLHGRPHVISASLDGTVRVWDLTAMTLVDRGRPVTAALLTHLDGRPHALTTGSPRRAIRAWDISTGTHREVPTWHKHELKTLAMAVLDGRQYAVVGAVDGMSLCDLATGGYSGYLEGHCARVHTIAVADLEGRPHVLSGSDRGSVVVHDLVGEEYRLRDFRDGQDLLLEKFKLVKDGMESVIAVDLARIGGRLYAISGNHRGSVEVWDLTTLTKHSLGFPPGELHLAALAVTDLHNRPHLMTGDRHGPVKVWKLALNSRDVDPVRTLVGHTAAVYAIAPVSLKGRPHALTGSDDQTVRVWDVGAGVCLATLHLPAPCQAIAAGPDGSVVLGVGHEVVALRLTI